MKEKIIFIICLLFIFILEYLGLWYYLKHYKGVLKKRNALLVIGLLLDVFILVAFVSIYHSFFNVF